MFGNPIIDLFASRYKLVPYCSYRPDPNAILVDAFTFNWGTNFNYIFPPFSILGAVLRKIVEDKADAILIAPLWPTQSWFPKVLQLLVDCLENSACEQNTCDTSVRQRESLSTPPQTSLDSLQIVRQSFEGQGLSKSVVDIIMHS